ncbi:MAG: ankyrin repeat domain-containing protein [Deltaproteobacteria bacterium]|nr:ankyrin repeat domain-containing protein [Deltaproteobacteria bacterium]
MKSILLALAVAGAVVYCPMARSSSPPKKYFKKGEKYEALPFGYGWPPEICDGRVPLDGGVVRLFQNRNEPGDILPPTNMPAPTADYYLSDEVPCVSGKPEGLARSFSYGGKVASAMPYRNGLLHGTVKHYFADGKLSLESLYSEGKKNGKTVEYETDGAVKSSVEYVADQPSGAAIYNDHYKKLSIAYRYENGRELGEPEITAASAQNGLITAAGSGWLGQMKKFLAAGAKAGEPGDGEYVPDTPMIAALEHGANPNLADGEGHTALQGAIQYGYVEVVELLMSKGADPSLKDKSGASPRSLAEASPKKAELLPLLEGKARARAAVDARARAECERKSEYLSRLAQADRAGLAKLFETCPADAISRKSLDDAMLDSAMRGRLDNVKLFLGKGASLQATEGQWHETALNLSAREGRTEVALYLLERGAQPDTADIHGYTPLMRAVHGEHVEIVRALLGKGAKADLKNKSGQSARDLAKACRSEELKALFR